MKKVLFVFFISILTACSNQEPKPSKPHVTTTVCKSPRPQICTQEYRPVCGARDNGVRCVAAPCASTDVATYSNGCMACGDLRVYSYRSGICQ